MTTGKALVVTCMAAMLLTPSVLGEIVYENDFSTRTSAGAVPYGGWREIGYVPGALVASDYEKPFDGGALQDNWIKGRNACHALASVVDDGGNPMALLYKSESDFNHVIIKQRLGNVFTSGVVTAQCDFKVPSQWVGYTVMSTRFELGDETYFSPETPANGDSGYLSYRVTSCGISYSNGCKYYRVGQSSTPTASKGGTIWYRAVVTANLDTKKYAVSIYELDASHPTLDTPTPETAAFVESDLDFYNTTKGVPLNSISAIGLAGYGMGSSTNVSDRAKDIMFDNIRVAHNGVECYVNDFTTRRSRCLAPSATTASYVATTLVTNTLAYANGDQLTKNLDTSADPQPVGKDGWRRLNNGANCTINLNVAQYTNNNAAVFNYNKNLIYGIAAQPLGQSFTDGKVHLSVDVRQAALVDTGSITVFLGSDALYSAKMADYLGCFFARAGVSGQKNGTDSDGLDMRTPCWHTSTAGNGADRSEVRAPTGASTQGKWYRIDIVADLDANTYDYSLYYVCPPTESPAYGAANGVLLFATNGIWRASAQDSIGCFALSCYYGIAYFDNVRVWHVPTGTTAERLVYSNTFSQRTVYYVSDRHEDRLVGTMKKNPGGPDGWTRLFKGTADILLVDDGAEAALGFDELGTTYEAWAAHDLGGLYRKGKVTAQFDMCAPLSWLGLTSEGKSAVWLGGDTFHEGSLNSDSYLRWAICGTGFNNIGHTAFAVWSGDGAGDGAWQTAGTATAGHWYRFVMTAALTGGTSDVTIYDMGTDHPTLATPTPVNAVATFSAVPFRRPAAARAGVSSLGIQARGVTNGSILRGDARVLIDNLRVSHNPRGFIVSFL